jgi:uncharacterized protein
MGRILIDTSAVHAFILRHDAHHAEADAYMRQILGKADTFVLLDLVFAETMTLVRSHSGPSISIHLGRELRQNPLYHWQSLGVEGERDTWAIFQQYDDKDWSYVDCALLAIAQRLGVNQIFSFDDHIDQMPYVTRVPKPASAYHARRR